MSDPRRILEDDPGEAQRRLLRSACLDTPPAGAKGRTLAAMGLAAAATAAATSSAAASTTGATGVSLAIKWLAICALGGTVILVAATQLSPLLSPKQPAPVASAASAPTMNEPIPPMPALAPSRPALPADLAVSSNAKVVTAPPNRVTSIPKAPSSPPATVSSVAEPEPTASGAPAQVTPATEVPPGLAAEVLALREARRALGSGQPSTTLRLLDAYEARFAHPTLLPEATVMRIEALLALGRTGEAHTIADKLLADQPNSAYAQRVRSLLGAATSTTP
jgi:hypothetical protein